MVLALTSSVMAQTAAPAAGPARGQRVVVTAVPGGVGVSYGLRAMPVRCRGDRFLLPFDVFRAKSFIRSQGGEMTGPALRLAPGLGRLSVVHAPRTPVPENAVQIECLAGKAQVTAGAGIKLIRR